ncbi:unnamed protein product [Rotaria sordida]|uniref:Uncharacterized protein n=1 Tax=Rotaria sordida TaxID=392033 RepID=A0A815N0H9_9BILA|nr:unnamed protein product [Rotaria sordida]
MRFDDLLPIVNQRKISNAIIKIDIETSEHFFISNRRIDVDIESSLTLKFALIIAERSELMFKQINIPFIMMEWANIKTIKYRANLILEFFLNRHYIPYDSETCQPQNRTNYLL